MSGWVIIFFKGAKVIISLASQPTSEVGWLARLGDYELNEVCCEIIHICMLLHAYLKLLINCVIRYSDYLWYDIHMSPVEVFTTRIKNLDQRKLSLIA